MDKKIIEYLDRGGVYYGGSAGAIIMGANIETVEEEKDREISSKGFNLLNNYSVRCHIESDDLDMMRDYCKRTSEMVLGLPEGAGVIYSLGNFTVVGDHIFRITKDSCDKLSKDTVFK